MDIEKWWGEWKGWQAKGRWDREKENFRRLSEWIPWLNFNIKNVQQIFAKEIFQTNGHLPDIWMHVVLWDVYGRVSQPQHCWRFWQVILSDGDYLVHCKTLAASLAPTHQMTVARMCPHIPPIANNQKCLQSWPNIPWSRTTGTGVPWAFIHSFIQQIWLMYLAILLFGTLINVCVPTLT